METHVETMETPMYGDYSDFYEDVDDSANMDDLERIYKAIDWLNIVAPPVQLLVGLWGNAVSAYVMWLHITTVNPFYLYAVVIALTDTMLLLVDVGSEWFMSLAHKDLNRDVIGQSDSMCKGFEFFRHFLVHMSSWITVCVAIEILRMTRDHRKLKNFKCERIKDTLVLLAVIFSTLNMHYFWTYGTTNVEIQIGPTLLKAPMCTFVAKNLQGYPEEEAFRDILEQIHWIVADIIPITVIIVIVGLTTHTYYKCDLRKYNSVPQRDYTADNINMSRDPQRDLINYSLWVVIVMFVFFRAPYFIVKEVNDALLTNLNRGLASDARWTLAVTVLNIWRNFNLSGKVVIYVATWSRFRQKLRTEFHKVAARIRRSFYMRSITRVVDRTELNEV
jgi:hypothetical protein